MVLNGPLNPENRAAIRNLGSVHILGQLLPLDPLDRDELTGILKTFDIHGRLAGCFS